MIKLGAVGQDRTLPPAVAAIDGVLYGMPPTGVLAVGVTVVALAVVHMLHMLHQLTEELGLVLAAGGVGGDPGPGGEVEHQGEQLV